MTTYITAYKSEYNDNIDFQEKFAEFPAKYVVDEENLLYKTSNIVHNLGDCDYDEESVNVTVTATVFDYKNNETNEESATFNVQLNDGEHLSQMGCWISTRDGDHEFSDEEIILFNAIDVVSLAENYAKEQLAKKYKYHNTNFNCAFNDQSLYIKEDLLSDEYSFVAINDAFNKLDYNFKELVYDKVFSCIEDAEAYLRRFRTQDHHDFRGLYLAFNSFKEI